MENTISGHHVDTGEALQDHVETRLTKTNERYNARMVSSHTTFERGEKMAFKCTITAHAPRSKVFKAVGEMPTAHAAFDSALTKLSTQIRRHVRENKDISHERIEDGEFAKP